MEVGEPEWVTAWSIPMAAPAERSESAAPSDGISLPIDPSELAAPAIALLILLLVDGSDWVSTVRTIAEAAVGSVAGALGTISDSLGGAEEPSLREVAEMAVTDGASVPEAVGAAGLYLARHALLYVSLQRWIFQWDARWWAVESDTLSE